jgi:hypothetical protein
MMIITAITRITMGIRGGASSLPDRHFSVGLRRAAAAGLRVVVFQAGMAVLQAEAFPAVAEFTAADLPAEAVDFTVAECPGAARLAEEEVFMAVVVLRVEAVADTVDRINQ